MVILAVTPLVLPLTINVVLAGEIVELIALHLILMVSPNFLVIIV